MELSPPELRFLLRLLEHSPDYRTRISNIKLGESKDPTSERNGACRDLYHRGFVKYIEEIQRYRLEPPGKAVLNSKPDELPVSASPQEMAMLKAAAKTGSAIPSQARKVPPEERQNLLHQLEDRGLVKSTRRQVRDVWLTPQGVQYLLSDCIPKGTARLTFSMVGNYLIFLRQSSGQAGAGGNISQNLSGPSSEAKAGAASADSLTSEGILATIRHLDQQLVTDNFLPIFHLREKLQPPLNREELDRALYELQSQDLIELSTLQDISNYSDQEVAAGIPQNIGGALFYISVTE
jgi:hypothetical protein